MKINSELLNQLAEDLPIIRPIKEFVHLNLLLPYQNQDFWQALKNVSEKFESYPFNSQDFYREKLKSQSIDEKKLKERLVQRLGNEAESVFNEFLSKNFEFTHHDARVAPMHEIWNKKLETNLTELSDGIFIKWLSSFLDQGICDWEMPESQNLSFYHVIKNLLNSSLFYPIPFKKKNIELYLLDHPEQTIDAALSFLCPNESLKEQYLQECIMTLRGWAGLVKTLEAQPSLLASQRKIDLMDFVAIKLFLEVSWIKHLDSNISAPTFMDIKGKHSLKHKEFETLRCLQECFEESLFQETIDDLKRISIKAQKISYQAVFCMDDRESSLRNFAEESDPELQTFGTAAHFGLEIMYQHSDQAFPKKQCPAPVNAKYYLAEKANVQKVKRNFSSYIKELFFPLLGERISGVVETTPDSKLQIVRDNDESLHGGLKAGYSYDEMADVVYSQLKVIGLLELQNLVFILGHGSTSNNNPYFATYGCGACSGRSGSANARVFSFMANHPEVRKIIQTKYNFLIKDTYFVAGFHDTTKDVIEIYNPSDIPEALRGKYGKVKETFEFATRKNAEYRSRLFKYKTFSGLKEVRLRSRSLFQPRPELGHTNVAYSIVGRRDLFKHLNLNRPAFFQSYDYKIDPDAKLLAASLGAVIPVTSGINLDYYFSAVDNTRFGAGSKLPQNVVGQFGVSHGTESDLRFGLPIQMIDQHEATRIFILVEQTAELAMKAISENPLVSQIVQNHWIYYACFDPYVKELFVFHHGQMKQVNNLEELWK